MRDDAEPKASRYSLACILNHIWLDRQMYVCTGAQFTYLYVSHVLRSQSTWRRLPGRAYGTVATRSVNCFLCGAALRTRRCCPDEVGRRLPWRKAMMSMSAARPRRVLVPSIRPSIPLAADAATNCCEPMSVMKTTTMDEHGGVLMRERRDV